MRGTCSLCGWDGSGSPPRADPDPRQWQGVAVIITVPITRGVRPPFPLHFPGRGLIYRTWQPLSEGMAFLGAGGWGAQRGRAALGGLQEEGPHVCRCGMCLAAATCLESINPLPCCLFPPPPSCSCGQKTCQPCGEISGPSKYHPWTLYPSLLFLELRSSSLGTVTLGISTCKL